MSANSPIAPLLTCRQQHAQWANTLHQSEQDIDQLLGLLTDLPTATIEPTAQTLQAYAEALLRLRTRLRQLQLTVICSGDGCAQAPTPQPCPDRRYVLPPVLNSPVSQLSAQCDQLQQHCQTYLGELVCLNLI